MNKLECVNQSENNRQYWTLRVKGMVYKFKIDKIFGKIKTLAMHKVLNFTRNKIKMKKKTNFKITDDR